MYSTDSMACPYQRGQASIVGCCAQGARRMLHPWRAEPSRAWPACSPRTAACSTSLNLMPSRSAFPRSPLLPSCRIGLVSSPVCHVYILQCLASTRLPNAHHSIQKSFMLESLSVLRLCATNAGTAHTPACIGSREPQDSKTLEWHIRLSRTVILLMLCCVLMM